MKKKIFNQKSKQSNQNLFDCRKKLDLNVIMSLHKLIGYSDYFDDFDLEFINHELKDEIVVLCYYYGLSVESNYDFLGKDLAKYLRKTISTLSTLSRIFEDCINDVHKHIERRNRKNMKYK